MAMSMSTIVDIAKAVSSDSKCISMKVGAVLLKDGHIISTGVNGTPKGFTNCCDMFTERGEEHTKWSYENEVHAEMNALLFCPVDTRGAIMVSTHSPCWNCTKHMLAAGISEIWFSEKYYRLSDEEFELIQRSCEMLDVTFKEVISD